MATQRFESSVTAVSWIPSEAITGPSKIPFELGVTHYDEPPPDRLDDLEAAPDERPFREANELRAFIEVEDGRIVNAGHSARATSARRRSGSGRPRCGSRRSSCPTSRPSPRSASRRPASSRRSAAGWACRRRGRCRTSRSSSSGRRSRGRPWRLTINADGSSSHELVGASPFPRHWIYDHDGRSSRSPA